MRASVLAFGLSLLLQYALLCANNGEIRPIAINPTSSPSPVADKRKWRVSGMGELQAGDGAPLSFTTYQSADGIPVTVIHGTFSSETRAVQELQTAAKKAERIVSDGSSRDSLGDVVGRRIILLVQNQPSKDLETAIVWTNENSFYEVISPSEPFALYWEKRYRANGP